MPSHEPTVFGAFVLAAMKRQDLKLRRLAALLHKSHGNLSSIINGKTVNNSPARPALEEMDRWADVLGLDPDERKQLVELAELAHTPPAIRDRYLAMKAALSDPQRRAASTPEPYAHEDARHTSPAARRKAARQPFVPDGQPVEAPAKEPAEW